MFKGHTKEEAKGVGKEEHISAGLACWKTELSLGRAKICEKHSELHKNFQVVFEEGRKDRKGTDCLFHSQEHFLILTSYGEEAKQQYFDFAFILSA